MRATTHRPGYQRRDFEVVDYEEYEFAASELLFRGPDPGPLTDGRHLTFFGAAQTFGCFTARPFATQVGEALGRPIRNFGYGGAGPRFFLEHPELIDEANRGTAAVVQVMSARSEDNAVYRSGGLELLTRRSDGGRIGANAAYAALLGGFDPVGPPPRTRLERGVRRRLAKRRARSVVAETRANWMTSMTRLLDALTVPTVLLWFSTRTPDHRVSYATLKGLFGEFPHLVDAAMVEKLRARADHYVQVVSAEGLPQTLYSRFDGQPTTVDPADDRPDLGGQTWSHNFYYPSPEMHDLAAAALVRSLKRQLPS